MDDGTFRILSGHQRVRACKELFEVTKDEKYQSVPCKVYSVGELSEEDARRIVIFTNTAQRGSLSTAEYAHSVVTLVQLEKQKAMYGSGIDVKDKVAKKMKIPRSEVFRYQNVSNLIKELLDVCGDKKRGEVISVREGEVLSKLTEAQQQHIYKKGHYKNLTPGRLSKLKNLSSTATNDDIDNIFKAEKEYRYSVVTTVKRPDDCETIGVHVKKNDTALLESLKQVIEGDSVLSDNIKELLKAVKRELNNESSASSAAENQKDAQV